VLVALHAILMEQLRETTGRQAIDLINKTRKAKSIQQRSKKIKGKKKELHE